LRWGRLLWYDADNTWHWISIDDVLWRRRISRYDGLRRHRLSRYDGGKAAIVVWGETIVKFSRNALAKQRKMFGVAEKINRMKNVPYSSTNR
jgi:hypothetical protein